MKQYFVGFDPLRLNENGFELMKNDAIFLSLYHDCRLKSFNYQPSNEFVFEFTKVYNSGHGPAKGASIKLILASPVVTSIESSGEGNYEDFNELILLSVQDSHITLDVTVGATSFIIDCTKMILDVTA